MASRLRPLWKQIQQHRLLTIVIVVVLIAVIAFAMAVWWFGWDWTGFTGGASQITTTSTSHGTTTATVKPAGKTLWDWLQLLIIPIMLAIGGFWLNQIQKDRDQKAADQQAQTERAIADDIQREAALQGYINKMSELLLDANRPLRNSQSGDEVRNIASVQTLTVLPRLGNVRKGIVLQFLYDSGLIKKDGRIIDLSGADLWEAHLREARLSKADLTRVKLGGATLSEADLSQAELSRANLSDACLRYFYPD